MSNVRPEQPRRVQLVASGYLVVDARVLLVHHRRFDRWVPPGGHVRRGEPFAAAAERELLEETGLCAQALSAAPVIHAPDHNATPEPVPFYVDIEREGFDPPALVQYFYMAVATPNTHDLVPQLSEVRECRWFSRESLRALNTFAQVRSVADWALRYHPHGVGSPG